MPDGFTLGPWYRSLNMYGTMGNGRIFPGDGAMAGFPYKRISPWEVKSKMVKYHFIHSKPKKLPVPPFWCPCMGRWDLFSVPLQNQRHSGKHRRNRLRLQNIQNTPQLLLLSISRNWNHWCVWQVHRPFLSGRAKKHVWWTQGTTVFAPTPLPGCGQRECCQHIGLCGILIRF